MSTMSLLKELRVPAPTLVGLCGRLVTANLESGAWLTPSSWSALHIVSVHVDL